MLDWLFINGAITTKIQGVIPVNDTIIGRGYGIFDFLQAKEGVPLFLSDHLDRFYNSAHILGISIPYSKDELQHAIRLLLIKNKTDAAGIKLIASGGIAADGYSVGPNQIIIYLSTFRKVSTEKFLTGVKLKLFSYKREIPEAKTINYLFPMYIAPLLISEGFEEPLYYDDWVRETARGNIFAFFGNKLVTPASGILKGVTRKHVMQVAQSLFEVEETNLSVKDLLNADELFMTRSIKRVLPVVQVDDSIIAEGGAGSRTLILARALFDYEESYIKNLR